MLIGITGKKGHGKDEAYRIIKRHYPNAERIAFGDLLKKSICATLGITLEQFEAMKNSPRARVVVLNQNNAMISELTIRQYIQNYGSEGHRMIPEFGEDFWVNLVLPMELNHFTRLVVVTDVRIGNEAQRVKDLGGTIIKIERDLPDDSDAHLTELGIDKWDYLVKNTTLDVFEDQILCAMGEIIYAHSY